MSVADDSNASGQPRQSSEVRSDRSTPASAADEHRAGGEDVTATADSPVSESNSRPPRPGNRRRRNRVGAEKPQPERLRPHPSGSPQAEARSQLERKGNPSPAVGSGTRGQPTPTPSRPATSRQSSREPGPEPRRRRTEGTRPPNQGNGRGLSGSPRNPNHYGEIPIRPDNTTFDATNDRLVCIARSHVIPEDFPVQYRRMTASSRLETVAASGTEFLLCDFSHTGPHVWPDQTVVTDDAEPPNP